MVELQHRDETKEWVARPIDALLHLESAGGPVVLPLKGGGCGLICSGRVLVNGISTLPFRVLDHADEIRLGDSVYYFSAESPLTSVPFHRNGAAPVHCARCKAPMNEGDPAIACPRCSSVNHAECWSYAEACPGGCRRPTSWLRWTPSIETEGGPENAAS